jgi:inner membrane protein
MRAMSSFLGHSLAAYSLASAVRQSLVSPLGRLSWAMWLIALASAPDIDYFIPALNSSAHHGLRITHSLAFSLILPLCTSGALYLARDTELQRGLLSICAALAGLSHLVLDFLVGVTPLPLLWPLSDALFVSPIGILPSAGRMQVMNYYFYRNLLIEVGVLAPILYVARALYRGELSVENRARIIVLLLIAGCFIAWSAGLSR